MASHLQNDLLALEKALLFLGTQVENQVRLAVTALLERKEDLALEVIQGDLEIDRQEVELEEDCLKILALHQPVAHDLRFVTAVLKIDNDLERIGDLAVNISKRAAYLVKTPQFPVPTLMQEMMEESMRMVRESLDAFVHGNADAARSICRDDDIVDDYHKRVWQQVHQPMLGDPNLIEAGVQMYSVSKSLERIADHATNIAEDVVYMVEGEIIRHSLRRVPGEDPADLDVQPGPSSGREGYRRLFSFRRDSSGARASGGMPCRSPDGSIRSRSGSSAERTPASAHGHGNADCNPERCPGCRGLPRSMNSSES